MITEAELQELLEFQTEGGTILSLYLDTDLSQQAKERVRLVLRDLLDRVSNRIHEADRQRVEKFFDFEYDWQSKGVVIFSSQEEGLWRAYPLSVPVSNGVFAFSRPYIKPLTDLLEEYGRYGVVLVDREGARMFLVHLGVIQEQDEVTGQDLRRHKQGGWAAQRYQRRVDKQAEQNLKLVAKATSAFCESGQCKRLIIGGSDETVAQFTEMLPKALRRKVVATISMDMTASPAQVLEASSQVIQDEQRRYEEEQVEAMVTAAASGGAGVMGLADTLGALQEGRLHRLIVAQGYEHEAYTCGDCGYIVAQEMKSCPLCAGKIKKMGNAVDYIVQKVVEGGGEVMVVRDSPALAKAGYIGALLRY